MSARRFLDVCSDCDKPESEHHLFNPATAPKACICDSNDWGDISAVPDVCAGFVKMMGEEICAHCEHDEACHTKAAP